MSGQFSVGVVIGGMIGSTFRSAMSGTRRALDSLSDTSRRLQERQNALTRATERYGQLGSSRMQHLNSELLRVSRTMEQIERQQRRLSAASATSDALKANRMALYGQGIEAYGMAQTVYHTVSPAVQQSMSFQDKMIDMSITAKYDNKTRDALAGQIKGWALKYNQYQDELQEAMGSLISDNIDNVSDIGFLMPDIARAATATRTSAQDWAKVAAVWQNSLKGAARDFGAVQNIMAYAGDQGSFEIPDQVKWMQSLAPMMAGIASGKEAVAEIGASLQIAKIGAGSTDEAANNFKNFLTKIFARDTQKQFADLGIDLQGSIASYKAAGISPIEGMLSVIERYLNAKSPEALAGFKSAMKIKNDTARDEALQALAKNFGLGDMFADMQVMAFIRPMLANMDRYREIRAGALRAADNDLLASAYDQRLKSPLEATKTLMVSSRDLAITLGDQLAPSFISLTQDLLPLIQGTKHWVATHPQFVSGAFKLISALLAIKIATVGLKLGLNLLISPFVNVWKTAVLLRTNWHRLTTALGEGGKLRWLVTGFSRLTSGGLKLSKVLAGSLVRGFMSAARAVLWIGRALMMNPIGLVITAVAAAAYLIYRNWGAVSGWFKQRWADIQEINWSPAGLLYKAFAAALKYLGVDLPAKFTDFGGHLVDGLINGIKNKWESLKSSVTGMGDSISGWFSEKLGIHSPSRVFMGFGDNIAQGAAIGLQRTTPLAALAGQRMASELLPRMPVSIQGPEIRDNTSGVRFSMPLPDINGFMSSAKNAIGAVINSLSSMPAIPLSTRASILPGQRLANEMTPDVPRIPSPEILAAGYSGRGAAATGGGTSGGIQVSFNPQFFLNGRETTAPAGLTGALNMSLHELEKMLERLLAQKQRKEYR
ncbi:phage tail tape measure protein [Escherichia coli]|uniref:phage tail tape measure protein n=1 Tax=Escherichia coli TaxID=562 RepID=UPI000C0428C0|nr:phage tail tape measure protein [Escherichia coli]PHL52097.1 phage tail tape measure protein [Escherichia coli]